MKNQAVIVLTTTAGVSHAESLAHKLVESRLAACVQIIERVQSVYSWEGRIESASESVLMIKTAENQYLEVEETIKTIHRENSWYQTPEILKIPASGGSAEYLGWLFQSVGMLGVRSDSDPGSRVESD